MGKKIKLRRGPSANLETSGADSGEILMTTDTNELYVGAGASNPPVRLGLDKTIVDQKITEIEKQVYERNLSDIAKTNFSIESLLTNQTRYNLFQMIVETFADQSGISPAFTQPGRHRIINGVLYGCYDFSGGTGGTGTSSYVKNWTVSNLTVSPFAGRAAAGSTSLAGLFDEQFDSGITTNKVYASGRDAANKSQDILTFNFSNPIPISSIVIFSYISTVYNFAGHLFANSGAGLVKENSFNKGTNINSNTVMGLFKNEVTELRFRGNNGDLGVDPYGTGGYGVNEIRVFTHVSTVISTTIPTGVSKINRIMFSASEDLSLPSSSVSYEILFDNDNYTTGYAIQKDILFTSIPSGATMFRIKMILVNGAGVKAYSAGWS